jgi:hypothetical protein
MIPRRDCNHLSFWIDAVCINQPDEKDKSCQVGLMAETYRQAYSLVALLGSVGGGSYLVLDYLKKLGENAEACGMDHGHELYRQI